MLDNNVSLDANLPVLRHKWTELERCFMTMEDMEPLTTALKIRYGASLTPIIGPPPFSFDTALKHLSEEPHGLLSSEEAHAITHFVAAVIASGEPRAGLPVKTSYPSTHSRLEANKNKPVTHIATCPTNPHSTLYAVECRDSKELGIYVLVYERVTLSQITRQGCTDVASLAKSLARRGYTTHPFCHTSFRARDHTFTRDDYVSYVLTRDRLLLNASLAIAAFSYGGILYRLATESVQQYGLFDYDGSAEQYVTHQSSFVSIDNLPTMVHYSLTPSEIEIIVGAYPDLDQQQKQISLYTWWPTPTVWDTSGFQVGYWTRACEAWFQQTLSKIRDQTHVPLTQSQWRKQLRRYAKLVKEFQNPLHN